MKLVRLLAFLAIGVVLASDDGRAQAVQDAGVSTVAADVKAWSFYGSVLTYLLADERNYAQPTFTADRDRLHLEARYNYEGQRTGSAWLGYNFSDGDDVEFALTPMFGVVFGDASGIAPGYKASLSWRKLALDSESEYVFDAHESSDNFFYTWSEFGWAPLEWLRVGLAVQHTKAYESEFEIQRGMLVGISYKRASFTTYIFNPDASRPTVILGISVR